MKLTRKWRSHDVDIEITDKWLEILNSLENFELVGICAGHVGDDNKYPYIGLQLKEDINEYFSDNWLKYAKIIEHEVSRIFNNDFFVAKLIVGKNNFSFKSVKFDNYNIGLNLTSPFERTMEEFLEINNLIWFQSSIDNILKFDLELNGIRRQLPKK
ncbi:MAG: hypothetical protein QMC67_03560 [Candidatus Wallbacteria bacterium]